MPLPAVAFGQRTDFQRNFGVPARPYHVIITSQKTGNTEIQVEGWLPEEITFDVSSQYEAPYAQGLNSAFPIIGEVARALGVNLVNQAMTIQVWQGGTELNFQIPLVLQAETDASRDVIQPIKKLLKLTMPKESVRGGVFEAPGPHVSIEKLQARVNAIKEATELASQNVVDSIPGVSNEYLIDKVGEKLFQGRETIQDLASRGIEVGAKFLEKAKSGDLMGLGQTTGNILSSVGSAGVGVASWLKKNGDQVAVNISREIINSIDNNISLYIGNFLFFPSVVITDVSQAYNVLIAPDGSPSRATVNVSFRTFYIPTQGDLDQMFLTGGAGSGLDPEVLSGSGLRADQGGET